MATFRFKGRSKTLLTVTSSQDILEMRRHPEYEEVDEAGEVVVTPLALHESTLKIRRENSAAPTPKKAKA